MAMSFKRCDECGKLLFEIYIKHFGHMFCNEGCAEAYGAVPKCQHEEEIKALKDLIAQQNESIEQLVLENKELKRAVDRFS